MKDYQEWTINESALKVNTFIELKNFPYTTIARVWHGDKIRKEIEAHRDLIVNAPETAYRLKKALEKIEQLELNLTEEIQQLKKELV